MQSVAKSSKNQSCYLKLSGRGGKGGENWRGREGVREVGHAGMLRLFSATPRAAAPRLLCPWVSPGKSTGVGCRSLLQGILPIQGSNPGLLHCRQILLPSEPPGKPVTPKGITLMGKCGIWTSQKTSSYTKMYDRFNNCCSCSEKGKIFGKTIISLTQ